MPSVIPLVAPASKNTSPDARSGMSPGRFHLEEANHADVVDELSREALIPQEGVDGIDAERGRPNFSTLTPNPVSDFAKFPRDSSRFPPAEIGQQREEFLELVGFSSTGTRWT